MAKVNAADITSYISKYSARYGKCPTHSDIADKFNVSRSTISYHLGKEGGVPPTTVRAVTAQTPAKVDYLKLEPAPLFAPTAEYLQAQKRLRLQRESQAGEVSANNAPVSERPLQEAGSAEREAFRHVFVAAPAAPVLKETPPMLNEGSAPAPKSVPRFIVAIMMFIGAGCAVMSMINTAAFLIGSGRPVPLAIATAVLTALFSGTAFFLGSLCRKEKIPGGVLLYGLAVVIIGFSVFSSIAVVYENMKTAEASSAEALEYVSQTAALLAVNEKKQADVATNIAQIQTEKEMLRSEAGYWANKSWAKHDDIQARISVAEGSIATWLARRSALLEEEGELKSRSTETAAATAKTVYAFLSGGDPQTDRALRFLALVIPAVFFDVAAPLMLGMALLFLKKSSMV